jgi:cell division protein FtsB
MPDIVTNELYAEIDRLRARVEELVAERDGYRNGQMQLQDTLSTVMDSNAKWAAENKRLCKRIADLESDMRERGVAE